ncbi:MAG: HlyD family efflux transporter periplasmic adaptor subunit, partial [Bacteroidota bacterium]
SLPGMVSFPEIGRKVRFVKEGEEVMAIVPERADDIVGKVRLPIPGSGKVRTGQKVIIKFDSYPYQEYGILVGYVEDKSLLPKGNEYLVVVSLDALQGGKILTSHSEQLDFDQEMQGMAEIVTEDRRFIERIFEKFIALFEDYSEI